MESKCKVKVVYGDPLLGKVYLDGELNIELLVPGVDDGTVSVDARDGSVSIEMKESSRYIAKFAVEFSCDSVDFESIDVWKECGVLFICCPLKSNEDQPARNIII